MPENLFKKLLADLDAQIDGQHPVSLTQRISSFFLHPGFHLIFRARLAIALSGNRFTKMFGKLIWYSNIVLSSSHISLTAKVEAGLRLPHATGIVIGEGVEIGRNVTLYQNVTIGRKSSAETEYPKIKDNVVIYANATVIGPIQVDQGAIIGANTVVIEDILANETVFAPKSIRKAPTE